MKKNYTEKEKENHPTTFLSCWRLYVAGRGWSIWFLCGKYICGLYCNTECVHLLLRLKNVLSVYEAVAFQKQNAMVFKRRAGRCTDVGPSTWMGGWGCWRRGSSGTPGMDPSQNWATTSYITSKCPIFVFVDPYIHRNLLVIPPPPEKCKAACPRASEYQNSSFQTLLF